MTETLPGMVLRVDKPEGPTSHDIVVRARRALRTRKVGHTGTLDPFASGLLLLCVGSATRLSSVLTGLPKEYVAEARLGVSTDTLDREGTVISERPGWQTLSSSEVEAALAALEGPFLQTPPAFSAKKLGGEAAHRKARRGEVVELAPVPVEVLEMEFLGWEPPLLRFRVACSSGTYIRALARDFGEALGVGAHLTVLRRTAVGPHRVEGAVLGDRLDVSAELAAARLPYRDALAHLPALEVGAAGAALLSAGRAVPAPSGELERWSEGGLGAAFLGEALVALVERRGGWVHPRRVMPGG